MTCFRGKVLCSLICDRNQQHFQLPQFLVSIWKFGSVFSWVKQVCNDGSVREDTFDPLVCSFTHITIKIWIKLAEII